MNKYDTVFASSLIQSIDTNASIVHPYSKLSLLALTLLPLLRVMFYYLHLGQGRLKAEYYRLSCYNLCFVLVNIEQSLRAEFGRKLES